MTTKAATSLAAEWKAKGLTDRQVDDLIAVAGQLATATGRSVIDSLAVVNEEVTGTLERRLIDRIRNTVNYGSDVGR